MLSVIFLFLIFLGNFNKVNSLTDHLHCEWFCTISGKSPVTGYKMEVWLNMSKLIDQKCLANTLYRNLKNTTTSGYVFVLLSRKEPDYHDGFSFLHLTTMTALNHMFQTEHMNKTAMKHVTCILQPMSNQTEITVSNGLDVLNSLRFYLSFDNQSWNIPFAGYVHLEGNHHISAGFSNGNVLEDYQLTLDSVYHNLSWLIRMGYVILFMSYYISLEDDVTQQKLTGSNDNELGSIEEHHPESSNNRKNAAASQTVATGSKKADDYVDLIDLNLICDPLSVGLPEDGVTQQRLTGSNDNELGSIEEHHPESSNNRKNAAASQTVATGSKKADDDVDLIDLDLFCHTLGKIKKERGTPEAQEHEVSGSSPEDGITQQRLTGSNDNELGSIEEHHPESSNNRKNAAASQTVATGSKKADDDVDLIDGKGSGSPIGIRNLFSYIFLNKENSDEEMWKKVCCAMIKFVILIMFPLGILPWIDVFVLGIPNLFFKGSTNLPLPYLTKLVLTFAFEKNPGLFVCVFVFGMRMLFVCFKPSSLTIKPNFIHQKHIVCFLKTCYFCGALFPPDQRSVCQECEKIETSEVSSIPDKIQQPFQLLGLETVKRNWKDNYENPVKKSSSGNKKHLQVIFEDSSSTNGVKNSSGNWFEKKLGKPQFLFLEFVSICFSIVWVAYISYCCSLSLLMAITSLLISGMKYPIETFSSVAIYVVTWHSIWTLYSLFTDKYFALLSKLFDICGNNHGDQMKKYTIGIKMYMPKALFDSACDKIEPVTENVKELFWQLFFYIIGHLFLFSIVCGTNYPKSVVLPVTLTFFIVVHPLLWDFLKKREQKEKLRESVKEGEIKNLVNDFFVGKIGKAYL